MVHIVLLLKYQQVPQQLRITATTSGLCDLPPLVPLLIIMRVYISVLTLSYRFFVKPVTSLQLAFLLAKTKLHFGVLVPLRVPGGVQHGGHIWTRFLDY